MDTINKSSRRRLARLVDADAPEEQSDLAGDFSPEASPFAHFRRAEIWVPTDVWADHVTDAYYGMHFEIGIVPPEDVAVEFAEIRLDLEPPIERLAAWLPNDVYSSFRQIEAQRKVDVKVDTGLAQLVTVLPGIADLLPQLSGEYSRVVKDHREPQESVVRTISDGRRRLSFKLSKDLKTGIDPQQFRGQVVFGVDGDPTGRPLTFSMQVMCRCGIFRLKNTLDQRVDITLRA
jgi:hypothetical protein